MDRLAGKGGTTISKKMEREPIRGEHEVEVRDDRGRVSTAKVHLRFCRMTVHPPIGKQRALPGVIADGHPRPRAGDARGPGADPMEPADEPARGGPRLGDREAGLVLPSAGRSETFHKVLKSGCQAEQSKLRTAERLTNLLAVLCIVGWRVFWLTMVNRATPEAPAEVALTKTEIEILDRMARETRSRPARPTVSHYLVAIAKLGGYLARAKDPPPGNMVIWRGLTRLMDIHLGFELRGRVVGN